MITVEQGFEDIREMFRDIKTNLTNHVTDTNKRITGLEDQVRHHGIALENLRAEINGKLDQLLKK